MHHIFTSNGVISTVHIRQIAIDTSQYFRNLESGSNIFLQKQLMRAEIVLYEHTT
jgi:hypothetical protein